jgi:hypothetical protein
MSEPSNIESTPAADLAGYPDVNALAQGYRQSGAEAQRQKARADALEQQIQELAAANQRNSQQQDVMSRLKEYGELGELVREVVRTETNQIVQDAFQPITKGLAARGEVLARYPDYAQHEQAAFSFVQSDPELSREYNAILRVDPAAAMKYAFMSYGMQQRQNVQPPGGNDEMAHAQIPNVRSGESRRQPDSTDRVRAAWERYQQTGSRGDAEMYAKARLRTVVTDEFLNQ